MYLQVMNNVLPTLLILVCGVSCGGGSPKLTSTPGNQGKLSQKDNGATSSKNRGSSLDLVKASAEKGNTKDQYKLGMTYQYGNGVRIDLKKAIKWYRMAAEQGYATAQFNFATMYSTGEGVPKNNKEAFKWYRMAAEQGHASSQAAIGKMYEKGESVPKDIVAAHAWYGVAASAYGYPEGRKEMSRVAKGMSREQLTKARNLTKDLRKQITQKTEKSDK